MKRLIAIFFCAPFAMAYSQVNLGRSGSESNALGVNQVQPIAGQQSLVNDSRILGTPMLSDDFVNGTIQVKTNEKAHNLMIDFSLFENQLYFQKDNTILKFAEPVYEFGLVVNNKNGKGKTLYNFRSGYPETGNNSTNTFYQVIADGSKIQLLKFLYKTVEDRHDYGAPAQKSYVLKEKLFVYDIKDKTLTEINTNANSLEKALPKYAIIIEKFEAKTKIKHEIEVNQLVEIINNGDMTAAR